MFAVQDITVGDVRRFVWDVKVTNLLTSPTVMSCHKDVWDVRTFVNIFLNETLFCESL